MRVHQVLAAVSATFLFAGVSAVHAAPALTVNPGSLGYASILPTFNADLIEGRYEEVVTLTPGNATSGTFAYSFAWVGQSYALNGAAVGCATGFPTFCTGLGSSYSMFATLQGTGAYSLTPTANPLQPIVTFTPAAGAGISLLVTGSPITLTQPATGAGGFTVTSTAPQIALISGTVTQAGGVLRPGVGTDFGSFGTITTAALTNPFGEQFFTAPRPFFNTTFTAGNFNQYWLTQLGNTPVTSVLGGQAQLTFANRVPEPSALALAGLALLAAGVASRRQRRN